MSKRILKTNDDENSNNDKGRVVVYVTGKCDLILTPNKV